MTERRRGALVWVGLFAGAALISGFTILREVDPFDEGLALQAARRVASGELPYSDFQWGYGPGGPYLLALLRELFGGDSLLQWRVVRVLVDAAIATTVFALVRRETASAPLALAGWLLAACAIAQPRSANPAATALLFALLAFFVGTGTESRRRIAGAGVLIALAAAFRIDLAAFGFAALAVALLPRWRAIAGAAGAAAATTLLLYLPFLVASGPADLADAIVGTALREGSYWRLPFPLHYGGGLGGPSAWKDALDFYVPLLLVIGTALALGALVLRRRDPRRATWAGLLVLAGGCLVYMTSRTDAFHAQPLVVVLAIVLPLAIAALWPRRAAVAPLVAVLALLLVAAFGNRASALLRPPALSTVHVAVADGVEAPPDEARAIEKTVALVDRLVPPGDAIYVLPRRSDLAPLSAPLVYVLAQRDNPTHFDHGLLTGAAAQRASVASLERAAPRALVRWTDPLSSRPEPNKRGRPSGVHTVDDWVAQHYRLAQRAGHYDVLVPR